MFFKQMIWDTMKEYDLLEKCKKTALLRCISSNLPSSKNIHKKIIYISHFQKIKNNFSFWTFQPQNVINLLLVKIKVFIFLLLLLFVFFVCLFVFCRKMIWRWKSKIFLHSSNKLHSLVISQNHLPARKNINMEFIYFLVNFSFVTVIRKSPGKIPFRRSAKYGR